MLIIILETFSYIEVRNRIKIKTISFILLKRDFSNYYFIILISLIKHILEYGIFLFAGVIILINRKFSPVALFFTIALIHYSYLFTGIAALLIAKMHNSLFLKK